jgi:hypothetical protein
MLLGAFVKTPEAADTRFVKIKKPFVNIYEFLDPKSKIIKQAQKGDHFELVYEGTSWYQVKIQEKVGWLEKRAATVVNSPAPTVFSMPIGTFILFILLLLGTFVAVSFFIYRQKTSEA